MEATVAERGWLLVLLVALPLISVGLTWVLGFVVGYLKSQLTGWRVAGVVALVISVAASSAGVVWSVFFVHTAFHWLRDSTYLWIVIPWVVALFLSYLMGERRKTLWDPVASCMDCIDEECC